MEKISKKDLCWLFFNLNLIYTGEIKIGNFSGTKVKTINSMAITNNQIIDVAWNFEFFFVYLNKRYSTK